MQKQALWLLLTCLWCVFTTAVHSTPVKQQVILTGQFEHIAEEAPRFQTYRNTISYDMESIQLPLNEEGQFRFAFDLAEPIVAQLIYGEEEFALYLEPGDSLQLLFKGDSTVVSGIGGSRNRCYLDFQTRFGTYNEDYLLYEMAERQALDFRSFMDGLFKQKKNFLQDRMTGADFSNAFRQYLYGEVNY